ncbi:MAG: hypothetical protein CIT03_02495 [Methanobacterium sp.]|nr:MAG: hypothetical protein CIT03_02495 [Methanobacterium sp.]
MGIEIVNFEGVDKLLSTSKTAFDLKNLIKYIRRNTNGKVEYKKLQDLIKNLKKLILSYQTGLLLKVIILKNSK